MRPEGCRRGSVSRKQEAKIKGALPGLGQRAFLFQLLCLGMHKLHIAEELNRQIQLLLGYLRIACGLKSNSESKLNRISFTLKMFNQHNST